MAKKFGRVEPILVEMPEKDRGGVMGFFVTQLNRVLEGLTTQINDVLQRATANLRDSSLWVRGEIIHIYPEDIQTDPDGNFIDVAVRHNLGVIPKHALLFVPEKRVDNKSALSWAINKSMIEWTDTHVFFLAPPSTLVSYTILLIP